MTRDEAIERLRDDGTKGPCAPPYTDASVLVDRLAALGVLKLEDEKTPWRGETIDAAIDMIGRLADRIEEGEPATASLLKELCREQNTPETYRMKVGHGVKIPAGDVPRCEPPPEHREKRWHWLRNGEAVEVARWEPTFSAWYLVLVTTSMLSERMHEAGWRYVAPCEEPRFLKGSRVRVVKMESGDAGLIGKFGTVVMREDKWCRIRLDRESAVRLFPVDCLEESPLSANQHAKGEAS